MRNINDISQDKVGALDFVELDNNPLLRHDADGRIYIEHFHSTAGDDEVSIRQFAKAHAIEYGENGEGEEITLSVRVPLSNILDGAIDIHAYGDGTLPIEEKSLFDRTRQELLALVAKIDQLQYR